MPSTANAPTAASIGMPHERGMATMHNGTYVPAIRR